MGKGTSFKMFKHYMYPLITVGISIVNMYKFNMCNSICQIIVLIINLDQNSISVTQYIS